MNRVKFSTNKEGLLAFRFRNGEVLHVKCNSTATSRTNKRLKLDQCAAPVFTEPMGLVSNELREIQIGEESQSLLPATLQNNNNSTPISDRGEFYAVEDSNFGQVLPVILEKVQMLADTPLVTDNIIIGFATPQTTLQIPFKQLDIGLQIGEGTYGVISEAKWNGQMYAVKRFKFTSKKEDIIKETEVLQYVHNINSAPIRINISFRRLQHECIVSLKGVTTDPSTNETRLVLEYMADGSLDDLLSRDGAHLSRADVIQIALDVAYGLHYLHSQKIIHRDLKGANVLVGYPN